MTKEITQDSLIIDKEYQEKNFKNIFPITRGKRFLVWACDLVITFAITYLAFHFGSYLIFYYATGYADIAKDAEYAEKVHNTILEENNLLFKKNDDDNFSAMLEYTFGEYTKSFIKERSYPEEFDNMDVFRTYYGVIRENTSQYISKLQYYDQRTSFFDVDTKINRAYLKENYINLFKPLLTPGDEMSDEGKKAYDKFLSDYFLEYYADVIDDINKNDLTYTNKDGKTYSYIEEQNKINKADALFNANIIGASFVAVAFGFGITYFLIPLLNKERKTLSMMMMRIQRVSVVDFLPQDRKHYLLTGFTSFLTNLGMLSLLALPQISINYIFNIPSLFIISLVSLLLVAVSLIVMIFHPLNRSLSDFGSGTVYISNDDLDEVYRIKGYDV